MTKVEHEAAATLWLLAQVAGDGLHYRQEGDAKSLCGDVWSESTSAPDFVKCPKCKLAMRNGGKDEKIEYAPFKWEPAYPVRPACYTPAFEETERRLLPGRVPSGGREALKRIGALCDVWSPFVRLVQRGNGHGSYVPKEGDHRREDDRIIWR